MTDLEVKIKKLSETAEIPIFAHENDVCADIRADEDVSLHQWEVVLVSTGIAMALPVGYECQIRPRSGLAIKNGIIVVNSPGTIDTGYRGEIKIILCNLGKEVFEVRKGMRIAQLAVRPVPPVTFVEVQELPETDRNIRGFGSTGIQ